MWVYQNSQTLAPWAAIYTFLYRINTSGVKNHFYYKSREGEKMTLQK